MPKIQWVTEKKPMHGFAVIGSTAIAVTITETVPQCIWPVEAKGLVPMVAGFVEPYGVAVLSSGGFDSLTFKKDIVGRYADRTALVLHLGDYDPSGEVMFRALAENIQALGGDVEFERIAVTRDHIDRFELQTKPPKREGNSHATSFNDERTVELEALRPADLKRLLTGAIERVMDMDALADSDLESGTIREGIEL